MSAHRVYILDRTNGQHTVYASWLPQLTLPHHIATKLSADWTPPDDAALIVTHYHYQLPEVAVLRRAVEQNAVPILILADGILEYRNTWMHPGLADGAIFQPILGHKLAVIGHSQARIVESWGNPGKCEIVGLPICDRLIGQQPGERRMGQPARILIATARTPGFDQHQLGEVARSLTDLKDWFADFGQPFCQPVWRLTGDMDQRIGVDQSGTSTSAMDLYDLLRQVDAVITTPSTLMLEAALAGLPVALLDYNNCPHYVPSAWTISAPEHISTVIRELVGPPEARLTFQRAVLHDALECATPATPRLLQLIHAMYRAGCRCRSEQIAVSLPARILDPFTPLPEAANCAEPKLMYPRNATFANHDLRSLQVELNHYQLQHEILVRQTHVLAQRNAELQQENERLHDIETAASPLHSVAKYAWNPLRVVRSRLRQTSTSPTSRGNT
jgi:hypothetical protein